VGNPEALLLVDHEKTEPLEADVGREEAMGPITTSTDPLARPSTTLRASEVVRKRDRTSTRIGYGAYLSENV